MLRLGDILYLGFVVTVCGLKIARSLRHSLLNKLHCLGSIQFHTVIAYFSDGCPGVQLRMSRLCEHVCACIPRLLDLSINI